MQPGHLGVFVRPHGIHSSMGRLVHVGVLGVLQRYALCVPCNLHYRKRAAACTIHIDGSLPLDPRTRPLSRTRNACLPGTSAFPPKQANRSSAPPDKLAEPLSHALTAHWGVLTVTVCARAGQDLSARPKVASKVKFWFLTPVWPLLSLDVTKHPARKQAGIPLVEWLRRFPLG
jgi:hypothetical protein